MRICRAEGRTHAPRSLGVPWPIVLVVTLLTLVASSGVHAAPPALLETTYTIKEYRQQRDRGQSTLTRAVSVTRFDQPVYVPSSCAPSPSDFRGAINSNSFLYITFLIPRRCVDVRL